MGDESGENGVPLREHIEAQFKAHEGVHTLEAQALEKAHLELNRRLDEMNELRRQIEHERGEYVGKAWFESKHRELEIRITNLEEWRWKAAGAIFAAMTAGGIMGWAVGLMLKK